MKNAILAATIIVLGLAFMALAQEPTEDQRQAAIAQIAAAAKNSPATFNLALFKYVKATPGMTDKQKLDAFGAWLQFAYDHGGARAEAPSEEQVFALPPVILGGAIHAAKVLVDRTVADAEKAAAEARANRLLLSETLLR